jgi:Fic family protein
MFEKIDKLKILLDEKRPFDAEIMGLLQEKLRIEWTYNSNAIEGNTLTHGETAFFLREGLTSEGKPLKDYIEAKNHAEAIDFLNEIVKSKRPLTEGFIKELHSLLMKGIEFTYAKGAAGKMIKKPLHAGMYKLRPNRVLTVSGKIHEYSAPEHVKDDMEALLNWYKDAKKMHPLKKAAEFHYRFVAIHPFDDGNGRMARLLMNLILMKAGYPPCIIRNENRRRYLEALELADFEGRTETFIDFIKDEMESSMKMMADVLSGKSKPLAPEVGGTLNRSQREDLILGVFGKKALSIGQIKERLPRIKRPTLKKDLQRLVKEKKLKVAGKGKGLVYLKR